MKKKAKTAFFCTHCGHSHSRWQGQCDSCFERNCLVEELIPSKENNFSKMGIEAERKPLKISEINPQDAKRLSVGMKEVDIVLGGGLVPGSLVLLGGEPGIGKSTLLLQVCKALCDKGKKILYLAGEESESQVKLRAQRLGLDSGEFYIFSEIQTQNIFSQCEVLKPDLMVVDSIQTMKSNELDSSPGSVSQVRECTLHFMEYCKLKNVACLLVGHVTKGGEIAGPRLLEHMVDVVLQFEGDKNNWFRMLRGIKNRFGATDEIGIFEMKESGLQAVENAGLAFMNSDHFSSGSCQSVLLEGNQPFLVEVQALVADNHFTYPKRTAMGLDLNRLQILLAVMEKRLGVRVGEYDVFVNITGGVKTKDTGLDLAVVAAILSSLKDHVLDQDLLVIGEVGLGGEVRMTSRMESRVRESLKQGYKKFHLPWRAKNLGLEEFAEYEVEMSYLKEIRKIQDLFR